MSETPDYMAMSGPEMLAACGSDASKWADAFCQAVRQGGPIHDEGWVMGWFANAIMHSYDVMTGTGPTVLPDGSAFFVAEVPTRHD